MNHHQHITMIRQGHHSDKSVILMNPPAGGQDLSDSELNSE